MWPDRVSNPGPLTNWSGALPTALRGPAMGSIIYYLTLLHAERSTLHTWTIVSNEQLCHIFLKSMHKKGTDNLSFLTIL